MSRLVPGLALFALALTACAGEAPDPFDCSDCNLLLVSLDTLRADHLGAYGYHRDTSPHLDAFAARSSLFTRAYSGSFATADAHMSIMTGLYPSVHRVRNATNLASPVVRLSPAIPTLAGVLQRAGFATVGFHGGGNVEPVYGFGRGFDRYQEVKEVDAAVEWLVGRQARGDEGRFFLFFHTYHTHDPYTPAPPFDTRYDPDYQGHMVADEDQLWARAANRTFPALRDLYWSQINPENEDDLRHVIALYDGEINEVDLMLHRLLETVAARFPRTVVVVTSDHGEEFYEHGRLTHLQIYDQLLRVPLVIRVPGAPPGRVEEPVSTVSIAPTVLELLGVAPPPTFQERSLVPHLRGQPRTEPVFAEKVFELLDGRSGIDANDPRHMALVAGAKKLLYVGDLELYDVLDDPGETNDLGEGDPDLRPMLRRMQAIQAANNALLARYYPPDKGYHRQLDAETIEQLRALGYLD